MKKTGIRMGLYKLSAHIIIALSFVFCALAALFTAFQHVHVDLDKDWLMPARSFPVDWVIAVILAFLLLFIGTHISSISEKALFLSLFFLYLATGIFLVLAVNPTLAGDPAMIFGYIPAFLSGDFTGLTDGKYFSYNPHLFGFAVYEIIVAQFAHHVRLLFFLNLLFVLGTDYFLWRIFRLLFPGEKYSALRKIILVILFMFLPPLFLMLYVYGTTPGLFFGILSLFFLLKYKENANETSSKFRWLLLSLVLLSIACILKQNFMILGIAIALILFLESLSAGKKSGFLIALVLLLFITVPQTLFMNMSRYLTGVDFGTGEPIQLYIAMGLQENKQNPLSNGWYNGYNFDTYAQSGYDEQASAQIGQDYIRTRVQEFLSSPRTAGRFFYHKYLSTWCEPTYGSITLGPAMHSSGESHNAIIGSLYEGDRLYTVYEHYLTGFQLLLYAGVLYTLLHYRRQLIKQPLLLLPCVYHIGGVLFHLVSETKSSYVYYYVLFLLPYGGAALYTLCKKRFRVL